MIHNTPKHSAESCCFVQSDAFFNLLLALCRLLPFVVWMADAWAEKLNGAGVKKEIVTAIIEQGYDSQELFLAAFVDGAAFEKWLVKLRGKCGAEFAALNADDWSTHPTAAKLRMFWRALQ